MPAVRPQEVQISDDDNHYIQEIKNFINQQISSVETELRDHFHTDPQFHLKAFVGQVPDEEEVQQFLLAYANLYDHSRKRWKVVPEVALFNRDLRDPFSDIINAVIYHFGYSNRTLSRGLRIVQGQMVPPPYLMIEGWGRNFCPLPYQSSMSSGDTGYGNYLSCVSPIMIRLERHRKQTDWSEAAVHARQCFIQQHNRKAVYAMLLTENNATLYMFDRSGVNCSIPVNFHRDPFTFIRFILGIASPDDKGVGFDTSIFWKGPARFLTAPGSDGHAITFELLEFSPIFFRRAIRCRSTVCWRAIDPMTGDVVLIKETWRPSHHAPESNFFQEVKRLGLVGVAPMITFEFNEDDNTANMRRIDPNTLIRDFKTFRSCTFSRIVFQDCGRPICEFHDRGEVLYALRDAIIGHRNLWRAGILHRDVSKGNVLIGERGGHMGSQGFLIDLDLALWTERADEFRASNSRAGTLPFQSINVLSSGDKERKAKCAPHSHLDDLESFFYVLCWVCFQYSGPGQQIDPLPQCLCTWTDKEFSESISHKKDMYFRRPDFEELVTDYFGSIFRNLCEQFRCFLKPLVEWIANGPPVGGWPRMRQLKLEAEIHYRAVLDIFENAIAEYEGEEAFTDSDDVVEEFFPPPPVPSAPFQKADASSMNGALRPLANLVRIANNATNNHPLSLDSAPSNKRAHFTDGDMEEENHPPKKLRN